MDIEITRQVFSPNGYDSSHTRPKVLWSRSRSLLTTVYINCVLSIAVICIGGFSTSLQVLVYKVHKVCYVLYNILSPCQGQYLLVSIGCVRSIILTCLDECLNHLTNVFTRCITCHVQHI